MWDKKTWLGLLVVFVVGLGLRMIGLGDFMTADEENWMLRSAGFYHKVFRDGDLGGTFMTTHPGATTMWLAGGGIAWQENRLGFDIDSSNLASFRKAALVPVVLAMAWLIVLAAGLLTKLAGLKQGVVVGLLLAMDPYLIGMSQIAHLDALLALFMLNAVLVFLIFLRGKNMGWLILAGVMTGLAMGTKFLPALWLLVFFAVLLLSANYNRLKKEWLVLIKTIGLGLGVAALTFFMVWPAILTRPDFQIGYIGRDAATVISDEHVEVVGASGRIAPASFYARTVGGRSTPLVLLLIVGVLAGAIRFAWHYKKMPLVLWFLIYATGFLGVISIVAKKADRYALPALVALLVVAGLGAAAAFERAIYLTPSPSPKLGEGSKVAVGVLLFVALLMVPIILSPYAIAYSNPLWPNIRSLSQQGWGEGLDEAARWLNRHPLGEDLFVASWYPGVTRTYFRAQTMSLSSRDDPRVGYVVLYRNMMGRGFDDEASDILREFVDREPVYIVYIQGQPYVWIYEQIGLHYFDKNAGEIFGEIEVGQTVTIDENNWSGIKIGMATFSGRNNTEDIILQIKESREAGTVLREVKVNARRIVDGEYQEFNFTPIEDSAGRSFYVSLTSPSSYAGNAVTVKYIDRDILPGEMWLRDRFRPDFDLAYSLGFD